MQICHSRNRASFWVSSALVAAMAGIGCGPGGGNSSSGAAGGSTTVFILNKVEWGRLVDLIDLNGEVVKRDLLIEPGLVGDSTYTISPNPLTDQSTLQILFAEGTTQFETVRASLNDALPVLDIKGSIGFGGEIESPPFPVVPRNAALQLTFNNKIDSSTVHANSILVSQGFNGSTPFAARFIVDSENERLLIIDPTISQYQADLEGGTPNSLGFPQGISELVFNVKIAIPVAQEQFTNLKDQFGHGLTPTTADPVENGRVVRTFRTGLTSDSEGEFLPDSIAPQILGFQQVSITSITSVSTTKKRLTYTFNLGGTSTQLSGGVCFFKPSVGDVFVQGSAYGQILASGDLVTIPTGPTRTSSFTVDVTVAQGTFATGVATTQHIYDDTTDGDGYSDSKKRPCFVDYSIAPASVTLSANPVATPHVVGVNPATTFTFHFTKPLNPATTLAHDTIVMGEQNLNPLNLPNTASSYGIVNPAGGGVLNSACNLVPIEIIPSFDQKSIQVKPANALRNDNIPFGSSTASACSSGSLATNNPNYLHLMLGSVGPQDLGGNSLPTVTSAQGQAGGNFDFQVSEIQPQCPTSTAVASNGIAIRFGTNNLVEDGATSNAVVHGQLAQLVAGQVAGRAVQRFSRLHAQNVSPNPNQLLDLYPVAANASQGVSPLVPIKTPLLPQGSRMMTLYRYHDLGFTMGDNRHATAATGLDGAIDDLSQFNLDVEGLNWSPFNGAVLPDRFSQIRINLSHSDWVPDVAQFIINMIPTLAYPNSGLQGGGLTQDFLNQSFESKNQGTLQSGLLPTTNVYTGSYLINPLLKFQNPPPPATGGTFLFPWPDFQQTFVWRDTRLVLNANGRIGNGAVGGANSNGVDPDEFCFVTGSFPGAACFTANQIVAAATWNPATNTNTRSKIVGFGWGGQTPPSIATVPSIGLPLLMEFKVYPDSTALATNEFQGLEANPTLTVTTIGIATLRPFFRILSGGGTFTNGSQLIINPDAELTPQGEVVPGTANQKTQAGDDVLYVGQVDFVTKTSVVYTRWFDTGVTTSGNPDYDKVIIEPTAEQLAPLGLSIELAFRGVNSAPNATDLNANSLDVYGNSTLNPTTGWKTDIDDIDGSRSFQVRITFKGNATAALAPWLTSLQVAWH